MDMLQWCTTRYLVDTSYLWSVVLATIFNNTCRLLGSYGATDVCNTTYSACVCVTYVASDSTVFPVILQAPCVRWPLRFRVLTVKKPTHLNGHCQTRNETDLQWNILSRHECIRENVSWLLCSAPLVTLMRAEMVYCTEPVSEDTRYRPERYNNMLMLVVITIVASENVCVAIGIGMVSILVSVAELEMERCKLSTNQTSHLHLQSRCPHQW